MSVLNPFDFANPVTEPRLFAGRARELAEVRYYIKLAAAQKGIGLAIVGDRTSGKTSLLNMAASEAQSQQFLSARMDLSRADVDTEQAFFQCLYESLMQAARRNRVWGDLTPDVYNAFRVAMTAGDATRLSEYCDLAFPRALAVATAAGKALANFPFALVVEDLETLVTSELCKRCAGIALLIDEGDHLANLPCILEKLRLIMSSSSNFIVIVAGTEQMLSSMDAVFSPIVRQFKRIRLIPYVSASETRECILSRLRVVEQEGMLSPDTYNDLHDLAQGHPYEAQLIAHYMYRRFQENPKAGFSITVSVLNDVLAEVERFRQLEHDRFAATLRKYTTEELKHLSWIVLYPRMSLYEKAIIDEAFERPGRVKENISKRRQKLKELASRFSNDKVICYNSQTKCYEINGDQFDRLYVKYLARSKRIEWRADERAMPALTEELIAIALCNLCEARTFPTLVLEPTVTRMEGEGDVASDPLAFTETRFYEVMNAIDRHLRSWEFRQAVRSFVDRVGTAMEEGDVGVLTPTMAVDAGLLAGQRTPREAAPTARVMLSSTGDTSRSMIWLQAREVSIGVEAWRERIEKTICDYAGSMEALGWTAALDGVDAETPVELEELLVIVRDRGWKNVSEAVLTALKESTVERYRQGDEAQAWCYADLGVKWTSGIERYEHLNNCGYLKLARKNADDAMKYLDSIELSSASWADLPRFNMAIALAMKGEYQAARQRLMELRDALASERVRREHSVIVMVAKVGRDGAGLEFEENQDGTLEEAVRESLRAVDIISGPEGRRS